MGDAAGHLMSVPPSTVNNMDARRLLITDLDNTLWDWFEAWYQSFTALVDGLVAISGIDRSLLEEQIKAVHQGRGTTEYSNLVREVPALVEFASGRDPFDVFDAALHAQNSRRKAATSLYPGVDETLRALKRAGVRIVAYTESGAYWSEWRIRHTGLDGVIDTLYSSPDHDIAAGVDIAGLRTGRYQGGYGLQKTEHLHVDLGVLKPNREVLNTILHGQRCSPVDAAYLGDSLMKDIAMAQGAGVLDIHAAYGQVQNRPEYDLLRRLTHWSDADVAAEAALARSNGVVVPTLVLRDGISEVLPVFGWPLVGSR
ncbi:HAD family hydrolase [Phycicoccus duodecadis]|uniref:Phosphoglycolate phosphatase n=1 Tax=Phycicoccus duodecadis TaxID=173053 RepID=A0A2N3YIL0_9MICO|nr:HAD family hydrolase [Phycicoccus duodecadis]PKW26687.1 phosphoglycolate phosphatase [Phycicoccus duodecadis]